MNATQLLSRLGDGALEVDQNDLVVSANTEAVRILGLPRRRLVGRPRPALVTPGRHRTERADGGRVEIFVSAATGGRLWLLKDLGRWCGAVGDETAGGALERALGQVWTGGALAASFAADDIHTLGRTLVHQGHALVPDCDVILARVPPENLEVFEVVAAEGNWAEGLLGSRFARAGSVAGQSMRESIVVETRVARSESSLSGVLAAGDINSIRAVPLISRRPLPDGRTALGTIGFHRRESRGFTDLERGLIDDFGRLSGIAVQRLEYRQAAEAAAARLQMVLDVAVDLASSLDVGDVVSRLVRRAADASVSERCVLLRIEGGETVVQDAYDVTGRPDDLGLRRSVASQPLMVECVERRRPVAGGRYRVDLLTPALRAALEDVRHTLTLPLELGGEVLAVLVLSRRREPAFGADDIATLQLIGNVAVLALRNAWLFAEARRASSVKSDFLNMAAHELRTPLTVIAGYLSMLADGSFGPAPAAWDRPVSMLGEKSNELGDLVEDLLIAARLETGRLATRFETLELGEVLEAARRRAEPRMRLLGGEIAIALPRPLGVSADPEQLARILDNLINNGLLHSERRPSVSLRATAAGGRVRLEIQDRGRGIAIEHHEKIFERFYRGGWSDRPAAGVTGLSLHISRELAIRQGGSLELAWSRPGRGSRFVLELPAARRRGR